MSPRPYRVCVICSGNICRSPYAEALLARAVAERGWEDRVEVSSAGTLGIVDSPAHELTLAAAAERGIDLLMFRSRALDGRLLLDTDLVVALGEEHLPWLGTRIDTAPPEVWLITAPGVVPPPADDPGILDPIGKDPHSYRASLTAIEATIEPLVTAIGRTVGLLDDGAAEPSPETS